MHELHLATVVISGQRLQLHSVRLSETFTFTEEEVHAKPPTVMPHLTRSSSTLPLSQSTARRSPNNMRVAEREYRRAGEALAKYYRTAVDT